MSKKLNHIILIFLFFTMIFTGCSNHENDFTTDEDAVTTTEAAESHPAEESKDTPIMLENNEAMITYLRSLTMNLINVPDELGDSCTIKILFPNEIEDLGSNDGVGTMQKIYPNVYYLKDNMYYRKGGHLTWNAMLGKEKTILYYPDSCWVLDSLYGERIE